MHGQEKRKMTGEEVAVISQTNTSLWRTEQSDAQAGSVANWPLSGKEKGVAAKNHQTVR
jgi:hypothetical protein